MLLQVRDHDTLVEIMQRYLVPHSTFIEPILRGMNQDGRRLEYTSEADRAEARGERLPFLGDKENAPPLAWVILWRGRNSNQFGSRINSRYKSWGYVFWDRGRLNESGGKKQLVPLVRRRRRR